MERSAILDTSKFVRIAVDWLLRSDIGQVIKTIVDDEAFPDYALPEETHWAKKQGAKQAYEKDLTAFRFVAEFGRWNQKITASHIRQV